MGIQGVDNAVYSIQLIVVKDSPHGFPEMPPYGEFYLLEITA
jgi:hypothetical protein